MFNISTFQMSITLSRFQVAQLKGKGETKHTVEGESAVIAD